MTDTSLAEAVSFLRQALGDDPQAPRYIQTVHRRGYRFLPAADRDPAPGSDPGGGRDRGQTPARIPTGSGSDPGSHFAGASGDRALLPRSSRRWGWNYCHGRSRCCARRWRSRRSGTSRGCRRPRRRRSRASTSGPWTARPSIAARRRSPSPRTAGSSPGRPATRRRTRARSTSAPVDRLDAARLPGTDGGASPFFSPDGRWIGFFADGKLKKIAASGGSPSIVADAPAPGGAAWGPDGRIAFAGAPRRRAVARLRSGRHGHGADHAASRPRRGPPSLSVLAARRRQRSSSPAPRRRSPTRRETSPSSRPDRQARAILRGGVTRAAAAGPGYLLISSGNDLQAATFDERTLTLTGGADSVLTSSPAGDGIAQFAVSPGGTLAAIRTPRPGRAVLDRSAPARTPARVGRLTSIADLARLAPRRGRHRRQQQLRHLDRRISATGALTRITFGGINVSPPGPPTDSASSSRRARRAPSGSRRAASPIAAAAQADRARRHAPLPFVRRGGRPPRGHHRRCPVDARPSASSPPAAARRSSSTTARSTKPAPAFSPDGRWLALESDESGRTEIVVRDLADGRRVALSTDGGIASALERRRTRRLLRRRPPPDARAFDPVAAAAASRSSSIAPARASSPSRPRGGS